MRITVSGIRGIWGDELTPAEIVRCVGAYATITEQHTAVVVGRDTRPSGETILPLVTSTLRSFGFGVIDIGIVPTPTVGITVRRSAEAGGGLGEYGSRPPAGGGIAITASHNPAEYNALKFFDSHGLFISGEQLIKLIAAYNTDKSPQKTESIGDYREDDNAIEKHIEQVLALPYVDLNAVRKRRFRVLYDANGGAGATLIPRLLTELGCQITCVGCELDGDFAHPPEPVPINLKGVADETARLGTNIGFATDPDADRLVLLSPSMGALSEELTLAIVMDYLLPQCSRPVVVNLSTSTLAEWIAKMYGVRVYRVPVGEVNVSRRMLEIGSVVGGEGNGGVIVPESHPGRDAAVGVALILSAMAKSGKAIDEIVAEFPQRTMVKMKVGWNETIIPKDELIAAFPNARVDTQDGVWLGFEDGFLHIRRSNTEPIVRIIAEAESIDNAQRRVEAAKKIID